MAKEIGIVVHKVQMNSEHYNGCWEFRRQLSGLQISTANHKSLSVKEVLRRFKEETRIPYKDIRIYVVDKSQFEQRFGVDTASALTFLKLTIGGFNPKAYFDWDLLSLSDDDRSRLNDMAIQTAKQEVDEAYKEYADNFVNIRTGSLEQCRASDARYDYYKAKCRALRQLKQQTIKSCFSELVFLTE